MIFLGYLPANICIRSWTEVNVAVLPTFLDGISNLRMGMYKILNWSKCGCFTLFSRRYLQLEDGDVPAADGSHQGDDGRFEVSLSNPNPDESLDQGFIDVELLNNSCGFGSVRIQISFGQVAPDTLSDSCPHLIFWHKNLWNFFKFVIQCHLIRLCLQTVPSTLNSFAADLLTY